MASTRITFRDTSWPGYHRSSPGRLTGTVGIEFSLAEIKKKNHLHQGLKNQKRVVFIKFFNAVSSFAELQFYTVNQF